MGRHFRRVLTAHETGNWYVEAPGEFTEDVIHHVPAVFDRRDYIFQQPMEEQINPLLEAIGHAVRSMPQLTDMEIEMAVRYEDAEMRADLDEAELSLSLTRLYTANGVQDPALTLFWKSKPPVPWAAETISAWGMEENAALLKLDEVDAPMVELHATLLL